MAFHQQPIYYIDIMDLVEFKWHVIDMCRLFFFADYRRQTCVHQLMEIDMLERYNL